MLNEAGFFQGDHDTRVELFPHARYGGEYRGGDFAHVLGDGLGVLDKVKFGACVQRKVFTAHALGNMAQRKKAHALVALVLRDQGVEPAHGVHQSTVEVHCALGLARGAGGVDQYRQVVRLAGRCALLELIGVRCQIGPAQDAQGVQADHIWIVQIAQALHVEHNNLAQTG